MRLKANIRCYIIIIKIYFPYLFVYFERIFFARNYYILSHTTLKCQMRRTLCVDDLKINYEIIKKCMRGPLLQSLIRMNRNKIM